MHHQTLKAHHQTHEFWRAVLERLIKRMFHTKHTKEMIQYTIKMSLINGEMTYFVSGKKFENYADAKQYCIDNAEMWHKTASITICGCNE